MPTQPLDTRRSEGEDLSERPIAPRRPVRASSDNPKPQDLHGNDIADRAGASHLAVWAIKRIFSPLQRWLYRATGGRFPASMGANRQVLLLTTKGRRSGKDRTVPVFYLREGAKIVICNVRPENERGTNPWVLNLGSHPVATLQIGSDVARYQARRALSEELDRLWPRLIELWPAYRSHYERGGRRHVFILDRLEA